MLKLDKIIRFGNWLDKIIAWIFVWLIGVACGYFWAWNALEGALK